MQKFERQAVKYKVHDESVEADGLKKSKGIETCLRVLFHNRLMGYFTVAWHYNLICM